MTKHTVTRHLNSLGHKIAQDHEKLDSKKVQTVTEIVTDADNHDETTTVSLIDIQLQQPRIDVALNSQVGRSNYNCYC